MTLTNILVVYFRFRKIPSWFTIIWFPIKKVLGGFFFCFSIMKPARVRIWHHLLKWITLVVLWIYFTKVTCANNPNIQIVTNNLLISDTTTLAFRRDWDRSRRDRMLRRWDRSRRVRCLLLDRKATINESTNVMQIDLRCDKYPSKWRFFYC